MSEEIHVGDIVPFTLTIKEKGAALDISAATLKEVSFDDPDPNNNVITKNINFLSDGTDGKLRYTTVKADLSSAGTWKVQVYIEHPQGCWHTQVKRFPVAPNLEEEN